MFDLLCDDLGFRGCDGADYYSAANSFVDQVVKRRRGECVRYGAARFEMLLLIGRLLCMLLFARQSHHSFQHIGDAVRQCRSQSCAIRCSAHARDGLRGVQQV